MSFGWDDANIEQVQFGGTLANTETTALHFDEDVVPAWVFQEPGLRSRGRVGRKSSCTKSPDAKIAIVIVEAEIFVRISLNHRSGYENRKRYDCERLTYQLTANCNEMSPRLSGRYEECFVSLSAADPWLIAKPERLY